MPAALAVRQNGGDAANLPVAALVEHDFQPRVLLAGAQQRSGFRVQRGTFAIDDAFPHRPQLRCIGDAIDLHVIGLVRPACRIGDARRPLRIVAEQQQPFAGLVQPTDRGDEADVRAIETPIHGVAALLVAQRRHQAARLVEHEVAMHDGGCLDAIDLDAGALQVDRMLGIADRAPVQPHASIADPAFGFAARAQAALGQHARQAVARTDHADRRPAITSRA